MASFAPKNGFVRPRFARDPEAPTASSRTGSPTGNRGPDRRLRLVPIGLVFAIAAFGSNARGQGPAKSDPRLADRDRYSAESARFRSEGKLDDAIASAQKMLAEERRILGPESDAAVGSLDRLADLFEDREDFASARKAREEILDIRTKTRPAAHWQLTDARRDLEDGDRLAALDPGSRKRLAEASRKVGDARAAGRYRDAAKLASESATLTEELLGERHGKTILALGILGNMLNLDYDLKEARRVQERAVALSKDVLGETHPNTLAALGNLSLTIRKLGDLAGARAIQERVVAICKETLGEDSYQTVLALDQLGVTLSTQGDLAAARPIQERVAAIYREKKGERDSSTLYALCNLALTLSSQGDLAGARAILERVLAIRKEDSGEAHPDTLYAHNLLAITLYSQGDLPGARGIQERIVAILKARSGEAHRETLWAMNTLAVILIAQGDLAAARPIQEKIVAIRTKESGERHPETLGAMNNLAVILRDQGQLPAARGMQERIVAIRKEVSGERHPDTLKSQGHLALTLEYQGELADASALLERVVALMDEVSGGSHPDTLSASNNLAILLRDRGETARALAISAKILGAARANVELSAVGQSQRQQLLMFAASRAYLDTYLSMTGPAEVDAAYAEVLAWKMAVTQRQRLARAASGSPEAAAKAGELRELTRELAAVAFSTPEPSRLDAWRKRVAALSERKERLEAELAGLSVEFRKRKNEAKVTPEQLRAALPAGTSLVDFLEYKRRPPAADSKGKPRDERSLVAFVVRPGEPVRRVELGRIAPLSEAIDRWRPLLADPRPGPGLEAAGRGVRRLIWEPLSLKTDDLRTVFVSPDGALGRIPFAALPGRVEGSYLVEELALAVVPIPRLLPGSAAGDRGVDVADAANSLLALGAVNFGSGSDPGAIGRSAATTTRRSPVAAFRPLDATAGEIAAVERWFKRRFPGGKVGELSGDAATEEAFRREAPNYRYVHLATHGFFAPPELRSALAASAPSAGVGLDPGLLSGLAFAGSNAWPTPLGRDDGILTAAEVADIDLRRVDLAVLSACETGLGEQAGGEGLLGLQRSFQVAGARAVVASLWNVDDERTRALMERFYEGLWQQGMSHSSALRSAQLSILRGGPPSPTTDGRTRGPTTPQGRVESGRLPPYFWASFLLSTDGR